MQETCDQRNNCGIDNVKIEQRKMSYALFGDDNGNIGMQEMVKEMHAVFTKTNWAVRSMVKIFIGIGAITGGLIGIIELFKRFK